MYLHIKIKRAIFFVIIPVFLLMWLVLSSNKEFFLSTVAEQNDDCVHLPILMYHGILKNSVKTGKFIVSCDEFESDLKYIKDNNYSTIVMQDLIDYVFEGKPLPKKPIILTFDDGYVNNYLYAFPIIKKYECKMVLSPIGKQVDEYSAQPSDNAGYAHATWNQLKEMKDSGLVELQNHSYNLHTTSKGRCGTKKIRRENLCDYKHVLSSDLNTMQAKFKEHLDYTPTTFVFPFGAVSNCSIDIIKELGFKCTLGCEGKINKFTRSSDKLYGLCRVLRPGRMSSQNFFKKYGL